MKNWKSCRRLLSLLLALCMVLTMGTSSFAASSEEENSAVAACKESVFRVCIGYRRSGTSSQSCSRMRRYSASVMGSTVPCLKP